MSNSLFIIKALIIVMTATLAASCASVHESNVSDLDNSNAVMMVVIDDPRSERRKRGISGPGYSARLAYDDDPLLHQAAAAIAKDHGLSILSEWPLRNLDVHCFAIAKPSAEVLAALESDSRVRWVQPFNDFAVENSGQPSHNDDSRINLFFNSISERGDNVTIAVIDTSADTSHPDLTQSRITKSNFAGNRGLPENEVHGTAVVGLIAAVPASPKGLSGLANKANVHLLRGCWQDDAGTGVCNTLTLALALDAAIDLQPDILNLSLSGPYDKVLDKLLALLLKKNTLVVAAYDDSRDPKKRFPKQKKGVIYAYGVDNKAKQLTSDNILYAPRHAISLTPQAGYDLISGHSIAAPRVTAMAACLINRQPNAARHEIITDLKQWLIQS